MRICSIHYVSRKTSNHFSNDNDRWYYWNGGNLKEFGKMNQVGVVCGEANKIIPLLLYTPKRLLDISHKRPWRIPVECYTTVPLALLLCFCLLFVLFIVCFCFPFLLFSLFFTNHKFQFPTSFRSSMTAHEDEGKRSVIFTMLGAHTITTSCKWRSTEARAAQRNDDPLHTKTM